MEGSTNKGFLFDAPFYGHVHANDSMAVVEFLESQLRLPVNNLLSAFESFKLFMKISGNYSRIYSILGPSILLHKFILAISDFN